MSCSSANTRSTPWCAGRALDRPAPPRSSAILRRTTASLHGAVESAAPECVVVHLAAEIASQRDPAKIERVNVGGTRKLIAACEAAGVHRIVFSSTVVHRGAKGAVLDEKTELPVETEYGRSKQEGERLLRESSLEEVIVRRQPRLRPRRLVRRRVRRSPPPAGSLRGDRVRQELVGRRQGRGRGACLRRRNRARPGWGSVSRRR